MIAASTTSTATVQKNNLATASWFGNKWGRRAQTVREATLSPLDPNNPRKFVRQRTVPRGGDDVSLTSRTSDSVTDAQKRFSRECDK